MKSRRLRPSSAPSTEGTATKQKKIKNKQGSNNGGVTNKPAKTLVGEVSLKVLQSHPGSQITCEKVLNEMLVQVQNTLVTHSFILSLIFNSIGQVTITARTLSQDVSRPSECQHSCI